MTTAALRSLLEQKRLLVMPCCHDALSAKLIQQAGFPATFMSGFAVSAARLGLPDTGLISFGEMLDQARTICRAVSIPVLGDGDTGYGNALNIKRTVREYAAAGLACVMIEDQVSPKRCGHTQGKQVVGFDEACLRIRAAVDAREEGADILIMARTDARGPAGLEEALQRLQAFHRLGADLLFLEAPRSIEEMERFCREVPGYKMANQIEHGLTPLLSPEELQRLGFAIAAYPLTLLQALISALEKALSDLAAGHHPQGLRDFEHVKAVLGFPEYYRQEQHYAASDRRD
ncbi:isocitrate lyase/PEP mutase family protein [Desulfofustis limnaeus]|jgi:2-methylisocitrate lyase-like PEP mutase family enzyme|uniref:Carboxyvinyl-carboxyphosphonate phosphorylmutase n=1 Tax=Desulfofustis limnaeus TaxID=2740163 RepID=A0ABM7W987_9BACT|nr:isocitrate lyase/PEP mutase family protein [Desulfofustis limnaeus]MDX9893979.1 isocitrate lyase/PEP mutase family protein [Desulfofustis sp.]BDD87499.1 carboxyvinyl-carboxyphosphonate phosphorylmutase [Desulfofustis limnaeus]